MPLARCVSSLLENRRGVRRSVTTKPSVESLEGRALLSHVPHPALNIPAVIHIEKAVPGVFPPADDPYWQPLRALDGRVLLPGPAIIRKVDVHRLIQDPRLENLVDPPPGVTYLYYGNANVQLWELQTSPRWQVERQRGGRVLEQLLTFEGKSVPVVLAGTVVRVVNDWTPASHNPEGNKVIVRTIFPNGSVAFVKYEHLQSDIPVKVGDDVQTSSMIGLVGRSGDIPATGPTHLTIVSWTPRGGGRYLQTVGTPGFIVLPDGSIGAVLPVTAGCAPTFVDSDQGVTHDDPDSDADDPGGVCN